MFELGDLVIGARNNGYGITKEGTEWVVYGFREASSYSPFGRIIIGPDHPQFFMHLTSHGKYNVAYTHNLVSHDNREIGQFFYVVSSSAFHLKEKGYMMKKINTNESLSELLLRPIE